MTRWFVPGRLEVLGKHTDYAGGRSLLAAVNRGISVEASGGGVGITATSDAAPGEIQLLPGAPNGLPAGHWGHYVQTVVDRLSANFWPPAPCRLRFTSDLPLASGMSSSSALVVATALALVDENRYSESERWRENITGPTSLAAYLAVIENGLTFGTLEGSRGVGTFGGSEDHTAMLCCAADRLALASFAPTVIHDQLPLPVEYAFVIAVSGVLAEKTGTAREDYNRAALATGELLRRWNTAQGSDHKTLAAVVQTEPEALERFAPLLVDDSYLQRRLIAFVTESERLIPAAAAALRRSEIAEFGDLAFASHENAALNLGNQVPETNWLVAQAARLGSLGASGFGAGFGGAVWALTPAVDAEDFGAQWLRDYRHQFPRNALATTLVTRPGPPALAEGCELFAPPN